MAGDFNSIYKQELKRVNLIDSDGDHHKEDRFFGVVKSGLRICGRGCSTGIFASGTGMGR
ncbi:MAG: hypothetical protein U9N82_08520 [Thermodesulfobacteriota bacterium]|nr:hypothetical protein [Thermodesulfobacteriota bacterium]